MSLVSFIGKRPWWELGMVTVGMLGGDIEVWCKQLCLVDLDHFR